jgi:hypothetical protein
MKKKLLYLLAIAGICLTAPVAMQASVIETFGGTGISCTNSYTTLACTNPPLNIWNTGDTLSQTFSGTGLASITQLSLNLSLYNNLTSGQSESWSISLNGTQLGTLSETGSAVTSYSQSFNFASIAGPNYTIVFTVLTPGVPNGDGTLGLLTGSSGTSTATLGPSSVTTPEPSSLLLFMTGVIGLAAVVVRSRSMAR